MLHLPADRLAELVDNEPTAQELAHLQGCVSCARERASFRALHELAARERGRLDEPLLSWEQLRHGLAEEGLITTKALAPQGADAASRRVTISVPTWALRIAASLMLVAAGAAAGRLTAPAAPAPEPVVAAETPAGSEGVASNVLAPSQTAFSSPAEAMTALQQAQQEYQRAAAFLMASDTSINQNTPTMFKQRLAALDELMGVTRSALTRAPHDPVINSYYLAAVGAREATLQQLELALPAGTKIDRF